MSNSLDYPHPNPNIKSYRMPYIQGQAREDRKFRKEEFMQAGSIHIIASSGFGVCQQDDAFGIIMIGASCYKGEAQ